MTRIKIIQILIPVTVKGMSHLFTQIYSFIFQGLNIKIKSRSNILFSYI